MSLITLINHPAAVLATDQLVYDAGEIGALENVVEKVQSLNALLASTQAQIASATASAKESGYAEGLEAAESSAREKLSSALLATQRACNEEREQLRNTGVQLALEIVRKIGLDLGEPESLSALAIHASIELAPEERATLLVSPVIVKEVRGQLERQNDSTRTNIVDVVADDSVNAGDCVLKTRYGTINAGLETQLAIIESSLHED